MIGIGKRIGNNKLQFTEGDAYASSQGGILVNPVCEQVQRNKLRGIALDAALAYVNAAMVAAKADGATVLLTAEEVVDQLPANYAEATFLYIPFARKAGVSYALKGPNLTIDRNSTATEVARDLLLDQAGLNVPRIEFYEDENLEPWSNTFSEWSLGANTASSLPVIASVLGFSFGVNLFATGASGNAYATSDFTPVASSVYTYTAFVKSQSGAVLSLGKASITTGGVVNYTAFKSLGNGVYFMVVVETSAASPSALQVGQTLSGYNDLGEAIYFAGVQARRGDHRGALPQHYLATSGAAAYTARPKGHLVDGQLTNLILFSDPENTTGKGGFTNAIVEINDWGIGLIQNKVVLDRDLGNALWYPSESVILEQDAPATVGAFVKILDGGEPSFGLNSTQGYFNIGGNSTLQENTYVIPVKDDVYFVYAQGTSNNSTNTGFLRWSGQNSGKIELSGFMLVEGHVHLIPSDYIPTNGAAATRLLEYVPTGPNLRVGPAADYQGVFSFRTRFYELPNQLAPICGNNPVGSGTWNYLGTAGIFRLRATTRTLSFSASMFSISDFENKEASFVIKKDNASHKVWINGEYLGEVVEDAGLDWCDNVSIYIGTPGKTMPVQLRQMAEWPLLSDEQCQILSQL